MQAAAVRVGCLVEASVVAVLFVTATGGCAVEELCVVAQFSSRLAYSTVWLFPRSEIA